MPMPSKDLTGQRFGRLLAQRVVGKTKQYRPIWECLCDCGIVKEVSAPNLLGANVKSCGCLLGENIKSHGLSGTPAHRSWKAAKQRCFDPNASNYHHYGGRGITMAPRWAADFGAFLADMGQPPEDRPELDRLDSDGNYAPGNCRWTSRIEQILNRRRTNWVDHEGEMISATELGRRLGIGRKMERRLKRPAVVAARALGPIPSGLLL